MAPATLPASVISFLSEALETDTFETYPLAGDASNRRYYRVVIEDQSYVLMSWEPFQNIDDYPFLSVQKHFAKHKVNVPKVIALSPELGQVLLEDLGDLTLERKFWEKQNQELVIPFYKQAIDELIKIHYVASNDRNNDCTAFKIDFNHERFLWEMNYGRKHLIETLAGVSLTATESKILDEVFSDICTQLDEQPKLISHRDYHSRNVMIKLGQMRVIDFQDARMGPIQYDLVSLVHDSYVDLNEESIESILDYYIHCAEDHRQQTFDRQEFHRIFQLQMIQRCFKACGSFASFYNTRQDERYLKYISGTLLKVSQCLKDFSQYHSFLKILEDHKILHRSFEVA